MSTENGTINGNCSEPSHKVEVLRHKMDKMMEDYHDEMKVLSSQPGGVAPLSSPNHTQCDTCEFTTDGPPTAVCKLRTCDTTDGDDHGRLKEELLKLHKELRLKDAAVERLSHIKDEVQVEVEELTASLFEEAHNMVREANMKQAYSEKLLQEANLKIDMLQAEVAALKTLVLTSTPSAPNRHLHPQLSVASSSSIFQKGHRRSPSNYELSSSPQTTAPQSTAAQVEPVPASPGTSDMAASSNNLESDPIHQEEFLSWLQSPSLGPHSHPFMERIYTEDILSCLNFSNTQKVLEAIEMNTMVVERVTGNSPFPKRCSLLDSPRICKYRMKLGEDQPWCYISHLCRNRIAAVCDLFCYLNYIQNGLVKSSPMEMFWEIMRRRKNIALARLGFPGV